MNPGHSQMLFICLGICHQMLVHLVFILDIVNRTLWRHAPSALYTLKKSSKKL